MLFATYGAAAATGTRVSIVFITSRETRCGVISKGWPIPAHSAAETAAQEAYEEAGIRRAMTAHAIGAFRLPQAVMEQAPMGRLSASRRTMSAPNNAILNNLVIAPPQFQRDNQA